MKIEECTLCNLHKTRKNIVPGIGPIPCDIMVIAEGPGAEEDKVGEPFVGRSGKLLTQWFESINLIREKNYFLDNIVKCRPPGNRDPYFEEMNCCAKTWLFKQIKEVNPKLIITVGRIASQYLLEMDTPIGRLVGRVFERDIGTIFPLYHPAYILRQPKIQEMVNKHLDHIAELIVGIKNE